MNAAHRFAILTTSLLAACAPPAGTKEASFPSSSSGSYSAASMPAPSTPGVPAREQVIAGIVVRPDLLCLPFAIHAADADADKALASAQALASELTQKLKALAPAGATRMRGIAVSPSVIQQTTSKEEAPAFALTADGVFEVALGETDFWTRTKLIAAFVTLSKREHDARKDQLVKVSFEQPNMRVTDPEAFRAKLTKQWVERAKAFADAAQTATTPLALVDCAAPGEIAQRPISNEEVGLTLSVSCRLDARK